MSEQQDMENMMNMKATDTTGSEYLQLPRIVEFIAERNVRSEDFDIIVLAFDLPREVYLENHNTINLKKGDAAGYLAREITQLEASQIMGQATKRDEEDLAYAKLMHEVCMRYDWTVAWGLNTTMEKVALKRYELQTKNTPQTNA